MRRRPSSFYLTTNYIIPGLALFCTAVFQINRYVGPELNDTQQLNLEYQGGAARYPNFPVARSILVQHKYHGRRKFN